MSRDLRAAREESAYVLDLIGKKTLTASERQRVVEESVRYWTAHVNAGFLQYRKSVSTDYRTVAWEDEGAVFRDVHGKSSSTFSRVSASTSSVTGTPGS
jgi:putrescine aminotransferase